MATSMVTMFAPDGSTGEIPSTNVRAAQAQGFKVAAQMKSPNGQTGYIPADKILEAAKAGFTMVPISAPDAAKAHYWDALTNPVGSGGQEQGVLGGIAQIGGQAIKSMVQPVAHPLDTLSGMYNMVRHPIDTAQGLIQNFKNDEAQGGLPLALENAGGQLLGTVEGGRALAAASGPVLNAAGKAAGRAALLGKTPEGAYESALKPSTTLSPAERDAAVQTGLQSGIPVSKAGLEKIGNLIDDYNQRIKAEIASDPTRPVSTVPALRNLYAVRARFANQVTPQPDLAEIDAVQRNFLNNPQIKPQIGPSPGSIPGEAAQAMKQGTYRALGDKAYGEVKGASIEAQKALARGLKEEIANQFPEIRNLNAAESKLLDLQPLLERAVNRTANHQLIGIGTPVAAGAAKAVTGSDLLGGVSGVMKGVLDNPAVKSRLAIAISKGGKIPYVQAAARVQSYLAALGSNVGAAQGYSSDGNPNPQATPQQ